MTDASSSSMVLSQGQRQEIERARQGDKVAYSRLYRLAGTILASGHALPPELASFLSERLLAIGAALDQQDTRKGLPEAVAPGLRRGRPRQRADMLAAVAATVNDLRATNPKRLKKQVVIGLAEHYGFDPEAVETMTHVVKRK